MHEFLDLWTVGKTVYEEEGLQEDIATFKAAENVSPLLRTLLTFSDLACLLTVEFFAYNFVLELFCLQLELICLQWERLSEPLKRTASKET